MRIQTFALKLAGLDYGETNPRRTPLLMIRDQEQRGRLYSRGPVIAFIAFLFRFFRLTFLAEPVFAHTIRARGIVTAAADRQIVRFNLIAADVTLFSLGFRLRFRLCD